jgi:gliding motility-associated-like protein
LKRAFLIIPAIIYLICRSVYSQDISGIVNYYLEVDSVFNDTVKVIGSMDDFDEGDYVIMIQMTGATILEPADFPRALGQIDSRRNCGKYEFLQIEKKVTPENYIVFTSYLANVYNNDEKMQLVKIMTGDELNVTNLVQASPWDGSKGGIVALMAFDRLVLGANISVSGQGFRGADPEDNYDGGCRYGLEIESTLDTCYFHYSQMNRAGYKGEGIITTSFELLKGIGHALNGGGGGNGLYSGGAGGSNYGQGGDGGQQYDGGCGTEVLEFAQGGFGAETEFYGYNRIIMGGGGGAGTENTPGRTGTSGGDGGGIVFILANTIIGNGSVTANGASVTGTASASGGGGGGGGVILIDVTNNDGDISLYARGGNGGSTGTNCTGSGGGGGGGAIMHNGSSLQATQVQASFGTRGYVDESCSSYSGFNGSPGAVIPDLILPLNGFLFNILYGGDTICQWQVPETITASQPKGGDGSYSYQWIKSIDESTWTPAEGTNNLISLSPVALDTTTYFRRVVTSTNPIDMSTITDSGKVVRVLVYPTIKNNYINATDTICKNVVPQKLGGGELSGGNDTYTYEWEYSEDLAEWQHASYDSAFYELAALDATRYYWRIVTSAQVCSDTSEIDTITVLELITNNDFITPDTTICYDDEAGTLSPRDPENGDGTYSYAWQKSENSGALWQPMPGETESSLEPGELYQTTLFRRIVYSGNDNACIDTSGSKEVIVVPSITSNNIFTDSSRYCAGDIPGIIHGEQPGGGTGSFLFSWLEKTEADWLVIAGETDSVYAPASIFDTTTLITRVIFSGEYNACKDTAVYLTIDVVPYISNVLGQDDQSMCEGDTPDPFTAGPAGGGSGSYIYEWLLQQEGSSTWDPAPDPNDNESYTPGPLYESTSYVRKVYSDICDDISDTIHVTVYELLRNNSIYGDTVQYACYNAGKLLEGTEPEGGNTPDYGYQWEYSDDLSAWIPAAGASPASEQNFLTNGLTDTSYFRRIVYSSTLKRECSDTTGHVKILINEIPEADIDTSQDTICAGDSIYVKFSVSGGHSPWSVTVGTGTVNRTATGITIGFDSIPVTLYSSGNLRLISVEDDSSCFADTSKSYGIINAKVYDVPDAFAGEDYEVCGKEYVLNAIRSISNSVCLWESADATFAEPGDETTRVTVDNYGSYIFIWTESNWQCYSTDSAQVIFYEAPVTADAGEDQTLEFIFTAELDALLPTVGYGTWSVSSGGGTFDDTTAYNAMVSYLDYENVLKWTVRNGVCPEISDSINIIVNPLKVMKGFSPNGDGINDEFIIEIDNAEKVEILIFDRMGHIILETDNYTDGNYWDGTSDSGNELPEGTYFYILKAKVEEKDEVMIRSYIELLR